MNEYNEYTESSGEYESESFPEYTESSGEYSDASWSEARRRSPPVRTAPRQNVYAPRPGGTNNPVTQAQLQAALARVSSQIGVNSNAIKTVDSRLRGVASDVGRQGSALRKEIGDRKKATDGLRRELQSTRELGAVVGLLSATATPGSTLATIAPLALLLPPETLGLGGSGGDSSGSLLGGNSLVPLVVIAAAAGAFGK